MEITLSSSDSYTYCMHTYRRKAFSKESAPDPRSPKKRSKTISIPTSCDLSCGIKEGGREGDLIKIKHDLKLKLQIHVIFQIPSHYRIAILGTFIWFLE